MTDHDEGRKTERAESREEDRDGETREADSNAETHEADSDGEGRQTQREDDRDGWTPDADKPQRKDDVTTDGPEGSVPEGGTDDLTDFEPPLETREFPLTTDELRHAYGEYRVDTDDGSEPLADLLDPADGETFGSPDEVRGRIETLADRR